MNTARLDLDMTSPLVYGAPGPGAWALDADHQSAPRGALMQELFVPNFVEGTRACFGRYGLPLDRLEAADVDGWTFIRAVPAGVPDTGKAPPPTFVLRIATRLVPELRRRCRTAADTIARRRWLVDARAWAAEYDHWARRIEDVLSVDVAALDDGALADHVRLAHELAADMIRRHFSLLGPTVAIGRLLVAGREWGLASDEVISVLRGSSPASSASRAPLRELASITAGLDLDTAESLRAVSPRAADLVDLYLRRYGWRPLGADLEAVCLAERRDQLADLVRAQGTPTNGVPDHDPLDDLRRRVPADDRGEFDELVAEARECFASLDDNSGVTAWALGALRRDLLEIGRRAQLRGATSRVDDVFNLRSTELFVLAAGGAPVGLDALDDRRRRREMAAMQPPPAVLGGPNVGPPDPGVFPQPLGVLAAAVGAFLEQKFTAAPDAPRSARTGSLTVTGHAPVAGVAVSSGRVGARIVVSRTPADALDRIEPGDILVCPYTTAAHNAIFPMLGGVVTQFGGPLGHTAIMAREFGIPAVVGADSLPTTLDGLHGELAADLAP